VTLSPGQRLHAELLEHGQVAMPAAREHQMQSVRRMAPDHDERREDRLIRRLFAAEEHRGARWTLCSHAADPWTLVVGIGLQSHALPEQQFALQHQTLLIRRMHVRRQLRAWLQPEHERSRRGVLVGDLTASIALDRM
jgi:hypothetical protein